MPFKPASFIASLNTLLRRPFQRNGEEAAERARNAQAFLDGEKRFRALIEQSPVAVCVARQLVILYANRAFQKMFALDDISDQAGLPLLNFFAPQVRGEIEERSQKRDRRLPVDTMYETLGLRGDGTTFHLLAQVTRVDLADGPATIAYLTDISTSKSYENALRISEEKFSSAFNNSPTLLYIDRISDARIVEVNQSFLDTFGFSRDEVINHTSFELGLWERTSDRDYFYDLYRQGQRHFTFPELSVRTKQKETILLAGSFSVIQIEGEDFSLAVMENITDLRRAEHALVDSEERFHTLVEQAPMAIMISRGVTPIYANQSLIAMMGYLDQAQFLSRSIVDYFMLTYPDLTFESLAQQIIQLPSPGELEIDLMRADGSRFPAHIFIKTISLADGEANVSFILDITERKQAEVQINASVKQLHALSAHLHTVREEERTAIAREIHDELGQALTGLKMDLFWMKNRIEKEPEYVQAGPILHKLSSLVMETDLLIDDVRRISTDLRPSILDTLGLVAAIEWLARDFQTRSGLTCQFQTSLNALPIEQGFATAVFRICQEALTNVVRHAQAENVIIQLKIQRGSLILTVEDDGKGIAGNKISRPGSLGILGMQERAFSFNGRVDFEKSARGGTCVIARFPTPPLNGDSRREDDNR